MNPGESRTDLIVLLQMHMDQNMLPIVNVLEHVLKLKRRSRIWLCPTAAFTLHAAHPFQTNLDRSGKEPCPEDLYICSYMPTLLALIRSRQLMKKRVLPSFVAIGHGQPGTGKGKALLAVDSELELAHKLQNTWVHLACHGKQDPAQPYFRHERRTLTLLDTMEKHLAQAEFAFLSACHTAGSRTVVGTLWEVDDAVAKDVVEAFYEYMFGDLKKGCDMDCTRAAWALKCATLRVLRRIAVSLAYVSDLNLVVVFLCI
ncbi:hypothetical protein EV424DRAFT_1536818 [Suillus variegatus]|nr:hypothetical protein EV424DRAFT_1536818 [Suillus variegatus]